MQELEELLGLMLLLETSHSRTRNRVSDICKMLQPTDALNVGNRSTKLNHLLGRGHSHRRAIQPNYWGMFPRPIWDRRLWQFD
jgi:hypothetical protein